MWQTQQDVSGSSGFSSVSNSWQTFNMAKRTFMLSQESLHSFLEEIYDDLGPSEMKKTYTSMHNAPVNKFWMQVASDFGSGTRHF